MNSRLIPISEKFKAVVIDMRPGNESMGVFKSTNKSWSMPKFIPVMYSPRVNNPSKVATPANICVQKTCTGCGFSAVLNQSAAPENINAMAVLAFIVVKPVKMLLRASIPRNHPNTATQPMIKTTAAQICAALLPNRTYFEFNTMFIDFHSRWSGVVIGLDLKQPANVGDCS